MDDDPDQRISFPLQLWTKLAPILPGDIRRKATRLIAKGDKLSDEGKVEAARVRYHQALELLELTGVHHLRKKVMTRLQDFEHAQ